MNETLKEPLARDPRRQSVDAKAAAKEARLKAALRNNLRRRKESGQHSASETD